MPLSVAGDSVSYSQRGVKAGEPCVTSRPPRVHSTHICAISYIKLNQLQVTAAGWRRGGPPGTWRQTACVHLPGPRWSLRTRPSQRPQWGRLGAPGPCAQLGCGTEVPSGRTCAWLSLGPPPPAREQPPAQHCRPWLTAQAAWGEGGLLGSGGGHQMGMVCSDIGVEIWPKDLT